MEPLAGLLSAVPTLEIHHNGGISSIDYGEAKADLRSGLDQGGFLDTGRPAGDEHGGSHGSGARFDRQGMVDVIQAIERRHFVKSMTSFADHAVWQDVYNAPSPVGDLYVKFTAGTVTAFLLLSFKEKGDG